MTSFASKFADIPSFMERVPRMLSLFVQACGFHLWHDRNLAVFGIYSPPHQRLVKNTPLPFDRRPADWPIFGPTTRYVQGMRDKHAKSLLFLPKV